MDPVTQTSITQPVQTNKSDSTSAVAVGAVGGGLVGLGGGVAAAKLKRVPDKDVFESMSNNDKVKEFLDRQVKDQYKEQLKSECDKLADIDINNLNDNDKKFLDSINLNHDVAPNELKDAIEKAKTDRLNKRTLLAENGIENKAARMTKGLEQANIINKEIPKVRDLGISSLRKNASQEELMKAYSSIDEFVAPSDKSFESMRKAFFKTIGIEGEEYENLLKENNELSATQKIDKAIVSKYKKYFQGETIQDFNDLSKLAEKKVKDLTNEKNNNVIKITESLEPYKQELEGELGKFREKLPVAENSVLKNEAFKDIKEGVIKTMKDSRLKSWAAVGAVACAALAGIGAYFATKPKQENVE